MQADQFTVGPQRSTARELIRLHREGSLDLSAVTTFNLDEYVGLSPSHDQSYQYFMQDNSFQHVNLSAESTHVPDGLATDLASHCLQYEEAIRDAGGIDLSVIVFSLKTRSRGFI